MMLRLALLFARLIAWRRVPAPASAGLKTGIGACAWAAEAPAPSAASTAATARGSFLLDIRDPSWRWAVAGNDPAPWAAVGRLPELARRRSSA